jgi:hypothetical protein
MLMLGEKQLRNLDATAKSLTNGTCSRLQAASQHAMHPPPPKKTKPSTKKAMSNSRAQTVWVVHSQVNRFPALPTKDGNVPFPNDVAFLLVHLTRTRSPSARNALALLFPGGVDKLIEAGAHLVANLVTHAQSPGLDCFLRGMPLDRQTEDKTDTRLEE